MWNEQILVVTLLQLIFNSVSVSNVDFLNTELGKTLIKKNSKMNDIVQKVGEVSEKIKFLGFMFGVEILRAL